MANPPAMRNVGVVVLSLIVVFQLLMNMSWSERPCKDLSLDTGVDTGISSDSVIVADDKKQDQEEELEQEQEQEPQHGSDSQGHPEPWVEVVTVTGCARRPDSVIGDLAVWCNDAGKQHEIRLQGKKIKRILTKAVGKAKGPQQEKSDMSQILLYFHEKYRNVDPAKRPIGVLIKEDDFSLCVTVDFIIESLVDMKLTDAMVNLSYGSGLFFVGLDYIPGYLSGEAKCTSTIDDCFRKLTRSFKTDLPLAVHRSDRSNQQQHTHHCDVRCFVKCKDAGMTTGQQVGFADRVSKLLLDGRTFSTGEKIYSCNSGGRGGYPYDAATWSKLCINPFPGK